MSGSGINLAEVADLRGRFKTMVLLSVVGPSLGSGGLGPVPGPLCADNLRPEVSGREEVGGTGIGLGVESVIFLLSPF